MSEEGDKTEDASPKRLAESRRKGEVPLSKDLNAAAVFTTLVAVLAGSAPTLVGTVLAYWSASFSQLSGPVSASVTLLSGLFVMAAVLALPLGFAFLTAIAVGMLQTQGMFSVEAMMPKLDRLKPSFKRIISKDGLIEVLKGSVKVSIAAAVVHATLRPHLPDLVALVGARPVGLLYLLGFLLKAVGLRLAIVALALGVADFLWQRHKHKKSLRMSREELKREYKESEGDPQHKAERQHLHKQLMADRSLNEVRKADFVVVNPDHIAVALRYDPELDEAPVVVAFGEHLRAQRIKELARQAGVPIFRDVSLARSLREVAEGDQIPAALYEAVAEIMRVVMGTQESNMTPPSPSPIDSPAVPANSSHWRRG